LKRSDPTPEMSDPQEDGGTRPAKISGNILPAT
jgi:hypothetical protein